MHICDYDTVGEWAKIRILQHFSLYLWHRLAGVCRVEVLYKCVVSLPYMRKTDFDIVIDRRGTGCTKFDAIVSAIGDRPEVLPMWIADMDFATPNFILDAVYRRLEHPVLGYSFPTQEYYDALKRWFVVQYGFEPKTEELSFTPGIVSGIFKILQCLTHEGDGVAICPPVYHPFAQVIKGSRRRVVEAPLLLNGQRYEIDWEALEAALQDAKVLIWCHPHNPGGRVWRQEELAEVARLAAKYGVYIISDEIHADLTFKSYRHIPFPTVSEEARRYSLSLMAPSKAFNMPGIIASQIYIPDETLRKTVFEYLETNCLNHANATTYGAVAAAYNYGKGWLDDALAYIESNIDYVRDYLSRHIPQVTMIEPEASFLIFLDCRGLGFECEEKLVEFFVEKAHLLLNNGSMFGTGGEGFMRLNVGVPRVVLTDAMERLRRAVEAL